RRLLLCAVGLCRRREVSLLGRGLLRGSLVLQRRRGVFGLLVALHLLHLIFEDACRLANTLGERGKTRCTENEQNDDEEQQNLHSSGVEETAHDELQAPKYVCASLRG